MKTYNELRWEERVEIQPRLESGDSLRAIGRSLGRAPSTISGECRRTCVERAGDKAQSAQLRSDRCRPQARVTRKLDDPALWETVQALLRGRGSPEQIAGILARGFPDAASYRVSHETIYSAVYLVPRGELRKELIGCLRQGRSTRKRRTRGVDRRGQIPDMQSIHVRPPEIEERLIPGHWEGALIKGGGNRSCVGTLVERTSGFVVLAKMSSASAADALESFGKALKGIPESLAQNAHGRPRQGDELPRGAELAYRCAGVLRRPAQPVAARQ
jgi:IS30 family transposase